MSRGRNAAGKLPPRARIAIGLLLSLCASAAGLGSITTASANDDPGLVLELDRDGYVVSARDLKTGESGPEIAVGLGSPANPTPSGRHRVGWVVLRPSWTPASGARAGGAQWMPPSFDSPMGVAKIPFADNGSIALHGGGDPRVLGQPISAGCVRTDDDSLLRLIGWMDLVGALGPPRWEGDDPMTAEIRRPVQRPTYVQVR